MILPSVPRSSNQVSGAVCMVTALVVPFESLNTIISAGVLLAFNFVTSSLLVLRHRSVFLSFASVANFARSFLHVQDRYAYARACVVRR